jgi:predicted nuclease of restriction endonuclease-like (RecB) superfamily
MSNRHTKVSNSGYSAVLINIKNKIQTAQHRAILSANKEMLHLYWEIGRLLSEKQTEEGWGAKILRKLSSDIRNELPDQKGFSERNLKLMTQFFREYPKLTRQDEETLAFPEENNYPESLSKFGQQLVAQIPWGHNILLMQKVKELDVRNWYMRQTISNGWSRNTLQTMIHSQLHVRQGSSVTNFEQIFPALQSDLARDVLKDPYIFDFLTLGFI